MRSYGRVCVCVYTCLRASETEGACMGVWGT